MQADGEPSTLITLLLDVRGLAMPTDADLEKALTLTPSPGTVAGLLSPGAHSRRREWP